MSKCAKCLYRVPVCSENGTHYNCSLPEDEAMSCLMGKKEAGLFLIIGKPEDEEQ